MDTQKYLTVLALKCYQRGLLLPLLLYSSSNISTYFVVFFLARVTLLCDTNT